MFANSETNRLDREIKKITGSRYDLLIFAWSKIGFASESLTSGRDLSIFSKFNHQARLLRVLMDLREDSIKLDEAKRASAKTLDGEIDL